MIEDVKKRKIYSEKLRLILKNSQKNNFNMTMTQSQNEKLWLQQKDQEEKKFDE